MFTADGEVVQAAEVLYKKPILVERGSFRPVTHLTMDMLEAAQAQFMQEPQVEGEETVVLMEMTLKNLSTSGRDRSHRFSRPGGHSRRAGPDRADLQLRRVSPAGQLPVPLHEEE